VVGNGNEATTKCVVWLGMLLALGTKKNILRVRKVCTHRTNCMIAEPSEKDGRHCVVKPIKQKKKDKGKSDDV